MLMPKNIPFEIVELIMEGRDNDPDNRFTLQNIFTRLIRERDKIKINPYAMPDPIYDSHTSVKTTVTDETGLTVTDTISVDSANSETTSNSTGTSHSRTTNGSDDYSHWTSIHGDDDDYDDDDLDDHDEPETDETDMSTIHLGCFEQKVTLEDGEVIFQGLIGSVSVKKELFVISFSN